MTFGTLELGTQHLVALTRTKVLYLTNEKQHFSLF